MFGQTRLPTLASTWQFLASMGAIKTTLESFKIT